MRISRSDPFTPGEEPRCPLKHRLGGNPGRPGLVAEDGQCTYNVTLRRVRESWLPWKSRKHHKFVCVCACVRVLERGRVNSRACSLAYPACNAYAPCCEVICGLLFHKIVRNYLIKGTIFRKPLLNTKCVLIFSTNFI